MAVRKSRKIVNAKAFGALKSCILRIAKNGYAPEEAMLTVRDSDRERLRSFARVNGITISDALTQVLDVVGVPRIKYTARNGRLAPVVEKLMKRLHAKDGNELYSLIRSGFADDALVEEYENL